jgi:hypothetical protein
MLAPHHKELLTAYVDGELTPRQRRHVARLLRRSGEARRLLERLQGDSREIRALPPCVPARDLVAPVLDAIGSRKLKPVRAPRINTPLRFPIWTGFAAAASVMVLVGVGTFLGYSHDRARPNNGSVANVGTGEEDTVVVPSIAEKGIVRAPSDKQKAPSDVPAATTPAADDSERSEFVPPLEDPFEKEKKRPPSNRTHSGSVFASGEKEQPGQLERIELTLPSVSKLSELEQAATARKLTEQLSAPGAYRIEILCKDAARSFPRVRAAFAAGKIDLVVDPLAQKRLKKPHYRNSFAIFMENLTPAEMVRLLARLAVVDRGGVGDKKSSEPRLEGTLVIQPWSSWDKSELASVLKANPAPVPLRPPMGPPVIDIHKPLSESTQSAVLEGKGPPRPAAERNSAIFLSLSGTRSDSGELRRFVASRQPLQTGTIQVFIVLRHVGP